MKKRFMSIAKNIKDNEAVTIGIKELSLASLPKIENVAFIKDEIAFVLNDGRVIYIPLAWSKKLHKATDSERMKFKNSGIHIFWDEIDEIIGVKNILFGKKLFI